MCIRIGSPKTFNFPFGKSEISFPFDTNGIFSFLCVPVLMRVRVFIFRILLN